jgi:arsenate reductase (glutaredoxin)
MSPEPIITIFHNPDCGTSRNTLALIRAAGFEPRVIEYLKTPPDRVTLQSLIARMGLSARALLRAKGTPFQELNLGRSDLTEEEAVEAMLAQPILINRPIVVTPLGVRLCRPSETVLEILLHDLTDNFVKEDGEIVHPKGRAPA